MKKPKRILRRVLRVLAVLVAIPLALIVLLAAVPFAASIGMKTEPLPPDASTVLRRAAVGERWMTGLGRLVDGLTPMPKSLPDAASYESENFYPGGDGAGQAWRLGYAQAIITPEDWKTKTYYEGGNLAIPARKLNNKLDELKVRVIALSDGGGINIFAAVDSIGVTNRQVRQIRALVADLGLNSVNIAATHVHSAVDSTGIYSKGGKADEGYIAFVNEKTAGAVRAAVANMELGRLYLSQIGQNSMEAFYEAIYGKVNAIVGFDEEKDTWDEAWDEKWGRAYNEVLAEASIEEYGLGEYIANRRMLGLPPTKLNKLRFAPDSPESRGTVLLNFAAHPFYGGYKWNGWAADSISGDYIYYMEEVINAAGADMIFLNGAVNGINPSSSCTPNISRDDRDAWAADYYKTQDWHIRRIGRDFAGIALAMTMPQEDIAGNELTNPDNDHGWEYRSIVAMMQDNGTVAETELVPQLSIRLSEVKIGIENPVIRWAAKRDMLNMNVLRDGKQLLGSTEIGYMELGGAVTIALLPGEFTPGLAWGGTDTTAARAIRMRDFGYPTLSESAGRDVLVFGLCNDEIGYVIPDSDYLMFYLPRNLAWRLLGEWDYDHYAELLSPGPHAAGVFAQAFAGLMGQAAP